MIFVTVGTHETPFDRLVDAARPLVEIDELVVQHGSSSVRVDGARTVDFLSFDELTDLVDSARLVVTHAGAGSVLVALAAGKRPVVVPRLHALGEAVDDHQLVFARHLAGAGLVTLVEDPDGLVDAVARNGSSDARLRGADALTEDLSRYLHEAVGCAT
jgi:UDP-N-acetylglucosamine transferase subunit ALG13